MENSLCGGGADIAAADSPRKKHIKKYACLYLCALPICGIAEGPGCKQLILWQFLMIRGGVSVPVPPFEQS
jgi:hypothetical protein